MLFFCKDTTPPADGQPQLPQQALPELQKPVICKKGKCAPYDPTKDRVSKRLFFGFDLHFRTFERPKTEAVNSKIMKLTSFKEVILRLFIARISPLECSVVE